MTILEPTLYANGALRLTRHGAGKGGNVLVHIPTGRQCNVSDHIAVSIDRVLTTRACPNPGLYWEQIEGWHGYKSEADMPVAHAS
jgi:hypothetical protein